MSRHVVDHPAQRIVGSAALRPLLGRPVVEIVQRRKAPLAGLDSLAGKLGI